MIHESTIAFNMESREYIKRIKNIGQWIILFNANRRAFPRPEFRDRIPPQLSADSPNERNCRASTHLLINVTPRLLSSRRMIVRERHGAHLIVIGR